MHANPTSLPAQTVCLSIHDYNNIQRKITSYQSRLKAYNNLQDLLFEREQAITYYKEQASRYEGLYRNTEQKLENMLALQQLGSNGNLGCHGSFQYQHQQQGQQQQQPYFPQFTNLDEAILQLPMSGGVKTQQEEFQSPGFMSCNMTVLEQITASQIDQNYPDLKQIIDDLQIDGLEESISTPWRLGEKEDPQHLAKDMSKTCLKKEDKGDKSAPLPSSVPEFSKKIFESVIQDNLRLQQTLQGIFNSEGHSVKGVLQSSEYEAIICQLRQELKEMQEKYTELQSLVQETKHGNMGKVAAIVTQQQNKITQLLRAINLKQTLLEGYMRDNTHLRFQLSNIPEKTPQSKEPIQKDEEPIQNDAKSLAEEDHQDPEGEIEKLTNRVQASTINPKMAPQAEGHSQSNDLLEEMKEKEEEIKRVQEKLVLVHEELDTEREKAKEYEALGAAQKKALTELESKLRKQQLQEQQLQKTATDLEAQVAELTQQVQQAAYEKGSHTAQCELQVAELKKELKEAQDLHNVYMQQIKTYQEDFNEMEKEREKLRGEKDQYEKMFKQQQGHINRFQTENNKLSNTLKQYQQHVEATKQIKHYAMAASHNTAMAAGLMPPTLGDPHNMSTCAMAMQQPVWDLQSARLPMLVAQDGPPSSLSDRSLGQHSDVNLQKAASVGSSGSGVEYPRSGGSKQSNQTTKLECPRCQREFTDVTAYRTHCHKCTDS